MEDFNQAGKIDPDLNCKDKIETLRKRLDYFRANFDSARELKP